MQILRFAKKLNNTELKGIKFKEIITYFALLPDKICEEKKTEEVLN